MTTPPRTIRWDVLRERLFTPEERAELDAQVEATLAEIREDAGLTQAEIAETLGIPQGTVSKLEHNPNPRIRALARYVHAVGGALEVIARFPDGSALRLRLDDLLTDDEHDPPHTA